MDEYHYILANIDWMELAEHLAACLASVLVFVYCIEEAKHGARKANRKC